MKISKTLAAAGMLAVSGAGLQAQDDLREEAAGPVEDVQESAGVLEQMIVNEPEMRDELQRAQGVFIVPDYAAASLFVGGAGGEGVLVVRRDQGWSDPMFYDIGSVSFGLQVGAEAGAMVMLLMTDEAVNSFLDENITSLTAEAGLTLVNWSAYAQGEAGELQDVILWTDTEGLSGDISLGFSNISFDEEESAAYYGTEAQEDQIASGNVDNPNENVIVLYLEQQA